MTVDKKCPLNIIEGSLGGDLNYCKEDECAWFIDGECAITKIARGLK